MLKYFFIALGAFLLMLGAMAAVYFLFIASLFSDVVGAAGKVFEGEPVEARVELLDGVPAGAGGYALVLSDLVTGQGARILRGAEEMETLRASLWFRETRKEGGLFSAVSEVGRARTEVATLLKDGAAIRIITCPTEECGAWFTLWDQQGARNSGFAPIRAAASAPGAAVDYVTGYYDSYDAYRAAHAAIAADPDRWFARPGAELAELAGDGMGEIRVSLPVVLLPYGPGQASEATENAARAALIALGQSWLGEVPGAVRVMQPWPREIYIDWQEPRDDRPLSLPGVSYRQSEIFLEMPLARQGEVEAAVRAKIGQSGFLPPDLLMLEDALHQAVALGGHDTACLPGCARVQSQRINHDTEIWPRPVPGWQIESWRLLDTDGDAQP